MEVFLLVRLLWFATGRCPEVRSRTEGATGAREDDNADALVDRNLAQTGMKFPVEGPGDAVETVGPVECNGGEVAVDLAEDGFLVGHGLYLVRICRESLTGKSVKYRG